MNILNELQGIFREIRDYIMLKKTADVLRVMESNCSGIVIISMFFMFFVLFFGAF